MRAHTANAMFNYAVGTHRLGVAQLAIQVDVVRLNVNVLHVYAA